MVGCAVCSRDVGGSGDSVGGIGPTSQEIAEKKMSQHESLGAIGGICEIRAKGRRRSG